MALLPKMKFLFLLSLWGSISIALGQTVDYTFADLPPCLLTSLELAQLGADDSVEPCIIVDVQPPPTSNNRTFVMTTVQLTPSNCADHRDGGGTAAQFLNADNDNQGVPIGFKQDFYVQVRYVSVVPGNPANLGSEEYTRRHVQLLESMVETLGAHYIAGTCSFAAAAERETARELQRIILTQVGPPGFYRDADGLVNPYVFGFHINSDSYAKPAIQQLAFLPDGPAKIPIRVIYRTKSEFFYSTCRAIVDAAEEFGFADVQTVLYDHEDDHDGDGTINQFDEELLGLLADQICPPVEGGAEVDYHPAIFTCTLTEQDILLERWRQNGCQPFALWATPSTWGWASDNAETIPYFQGGGQWHPGFSFGDNYFESGAAMLAYNENIFGYPGAYDTLVSYAMIVFFTQHLQAAYRILDDPDPAADFSSPEGYERLRRDMLILKVDTIFGSISFNEDQRNVGRGAAGTQWLPTIDDNNATVYKNFLVAPFQEAEGAQVAPAPVAEPCTAGSFVNLTRTSFEDSLLEEKCSTCPMDAFTTKPNMQLQCKACPGDASTDLLTGQTFCVAADDNLVGAGLRLLGNLGVIITWMLGVYFATWTIRHRTDPVVKIGQSEFLLMICIAAMVSSSAVVFLGFEAGSEDDESWADLGCHIAPFLYAAGWVTEYSSLSVKTYRLYRITNNQTFRRVEIKSSHMFFFVAAVLFVEMGLVTAMTIVSPLHYVRSVTNRDVTDEVITLKTAGACEIGGDAWAFIGPLIAIHASLQLGTNWLLFKVRGVTDRYQEQKFVALASLFVAEVLVIGIPVLVAVQDSPAARYIVIAAIIILNDIGILCFVFLPKMRYQKEGLPEGVGIGESIDRAAMSRAISRRSQSFSVTAPSSVSQMAVNGRPRPLVSNVSEGSSSVEAVDEIDRARGKKSWPNNTAKPKNGRSWGGLGFLTNRSSEKSEDSASDMAGLPRHSWGAAGFRSTGENLESIVEASAELSSGQEEDARKSQNTNNSAISQTSETEKLPEPGQLVADVQKRVQTRMAQRLAMVEDRAATESDSPECAPGSPEETAADTEVKEPGTEGDKESPDQMVDRLSAKL